MSYGGSIGNAVGIIMVVGAIKKINRNPLKKKTKKRKKKK